LKDPEAAPVGDDRLDVLIVTMEPPGDDTDAALTEGEGDPPEANPANGAKPTPQPKCDPKFISIPKGIVTLPHEERERTIRGTDFHAAATTLRHVLIAAARSTWCD